MTYAEQLMNQGYAGTLAVSVPLNKQGMAYLPLCNQRRAYLPDHLLPPRAIHNARRSPGAPSLSQENECKSADVLTAQFHIARDRVTCSGVTRASRAWWPTAKISLVSFTRPETSWAYQLAYQTAAFLKVARHNVC